MTKNDRDKRLREIAAELKRIRDIPIRQLSAGSQASNSDSQSGQKSYDSALYRLIMARNMLRGITSPRSGD